MSVQDFLWRLLDQAGPFLWLIKPTLSVGAFVILLLRAPPECWGERFGRMLCFLGLVLIVLALANSALGPLGDSLFFLGYVATLLHRRHVEPQRGQVRPKSSRPPLPIR